MNKNYYFEIPYVNAEHKNTYILKVKKKQHGYKNVMIVENENKKKQKKVKNHIRTVEQRTENQMHVLGM